MQYLFGMMLINREIDTEIDWEAYMQQVAQFLSGEHDYVKISGGTGPLVYPAVHVYIYSGLYWLTDKGRDIKLAQGIFAALYLFTLGGVMACYRRAKVGFIFLDHISKLSEISPFEALLTLI